VLLTDDLREALRAPAAIECGAVGHLVRIASGAAAPRGSGAAAAEKREVLQCV
jgi:hypothetical protein